MESEGLGGGWRINLVGQSDWVERRTRKALAEFLNSSASGGESQQTMPVKVMAVAPSFPLSVAQLLSVQLRGLPRTTVMIEKMSLMLLFAFV